MRFADGSSAGWLIEQRDAIQVWNRSGASKRSVEWSLGGAMNPPPTSIADLSCNGEHDPDLTNPKGMLAIKQSKAGSSGQSVDRAVFTSLLCGQ